MFNSASFPEEPGTTIEEDRFRSVEVDLVFRRVHCYNCSLTAVYKYQVLQIRRHSEIGSQENEEIRSDHKAIWRAIPRFAEIPQTLKCKRCGEVLGVYTECLY